MAPPRIPPELVADIIELTVELLIEEERHLKRQAPLSNRFLLSAALVDRTWNAIATKALLERGIVTSGSVVGFLAQVKAHGMEDTLGSVRFGEAGSGVKEEDAADEDTAFDLLVESLPGLESVELVESGSHFQAALPPGRPIRQLHLSNPEWLKEGFKRKFERSPPSHLVITETRRNDKHVDPAVDRATALTAFHRVFSDIESLRLTTSQPTSIVHLCLMVMIVERPQPRIRTFHYECTSARGYHTFLDFNENSQAQIFDYTHLEHITTHLFVAHWLLLPGAQPNLTSLHILPNLAGSLDHLFESSREAKILDLIENLPVLEKLRVPVCWASDALREACEAKGVVLLLE